MPQFFPDGPAAVSMNNLNEQGGINLPPESSMAFETAGMQGSMQQLLSENLGKFVLADFLVGVSNIVRRVGILYSVGRSYLVLYLEEYHTFQVCDIFSLKFISFFPPGSEPSLEQLLRGEFATGILAPGTGGILTPSMSGILGSTTSGGGAYAEPSGRSTSGMGSNMGMGGSMNMGSGMSNSRSMNNSGSRTLGQR